MIEKNILGDCQIGEQIEFLVDEGDAAAGRISRFQRRVGRAGKPHCAAAGLQDSADDIHQRALARAILADETQDAATLERQVHIAHGMDAGKCLRDSSQLKNGIRHGPLSPARRRVRVTSRAAATRIIPPLTTSM